MLCAPLPLLNTFSYSLISVPARAVKPLRRQVFAFLSSPPASLMLPSPANPAPSLPPPPVLQTPEQKTSQIAALHKRTASHGVIPLSDDNYAFFAVEKPRPYHVIALFTATVRPASLSPSIPFLPLSLFSFS